MRASDPVTPNCNLPNAPVLGAGVSACLLIWSVVVVVVVTPSPLPTSMIGIGKTTVAGSLRGQFRIESVKLSHWGTSYTTGSMDGSNDECDANVGSAAEKIENGFQCIRQWRTLCQNNHEVHVLLLAVYDVSYWHNTPKLSLMIIRKFGGTLNS